jgi:Fe-S-cluster containining protein
MRVREKVQEVLRESLVSDSADATPWYADGLCFSCTQCGNCCSGAPGHVWVTTAEIERIAAFCNLTVEDFSRRHLRRVGFGRSLLELPGGDCEFLDRLPDGKTQCRIHPVRPVQCRTWPFWKSNLSTPGDWQSAATGCPGINRGEHHPLPVIQAALRDNGRRPL